MPESYLEQLKHDPATDEQVERYAAGITKGCLTAASPNVVAALCVRIRELVKAVAGASGEGPDSAPVECAQCREIGGDAGHGVSPHPDLCLKCGLCLKCCECAQPKRDDHWPYVDGKWDLSRLLPDRVRNAKVQRKGDTTT